MLIANGCDVKAVQAPMRHTSAKTLWMSTATCGPTQRRNHPCCTQWSDCGTDGVVRSKTLRALCGPNGPKQPNRPVQSG